MPRAVVLAHGDDVLADVLGSGPEVDERILANERAQVVRFMYFVTGVACEPTDMFRISYGRYA